MGRSSPSMCDEICWARLRDFACLWKSGSRLHFCSSLSQTHSQPWHPDFTPHPDFINMHTHSPYKWSMLQWRQKKSKVAQLGSIHGRSWTGKTSPVTWDLKQSSCHRLTSWPVSFEMWKSFMAARFTSTCFWLLYRSVRRKSKTNFGMRSDRRFQKKHAARLAVPLPQTRAHS